MLTDLTFTVERVAPEPYSAAPNLTAFVRVDEAAGATVHAMVLGCQVRIEPQRRRHTDAEAAGLADLFGPRERWTTTLRPFQWLQTTATVQGFTGSTHVELPLTCTYDFEVTAAKYLHALEESGAGVPLIFLFSGSVFTRGGPGSPGFSAERVPWDRESRYDLPVAVWRDLVRQHYPNSGWLRLEDDTLRALMRYKAGRGLTSLDATVALLLLHEAERAAGGGAL